MFETMLELMGMMFLLMIIGAILRKLKIITDEGKRCLTDIIIDAVLPCNIIKAFTTKMEEGILQKFTVLVVVAIGVQIIALIGTRILYQKMNEKEKPIYQYATVCSNAGFLGNPMAEGVFGNIGLMYASIFLIPQRIIMWTAGISYFSQEQDKKATYKKVITHPCMIATYIGFVLMISHISLPGVIDSTIKSVSNCCTPLTMMYMGIILADVRLKGLVTKKLLYFSFIRLIGMPLVIFLICLVAQIDPLITGVAVLLTGMPAGSTTSLLAFKYGADEQAATKCVVLTTVLAIITIPIWSMLLVSRL